MKVYSVWDTLARSYSGLFVVAHDAPAIRAFRDSLHDAKSPWSAHPGDFELHALAHFEPSPTAEFFKMGGIIEELLPVEVVVTGAAIVAADSVGPQLAEA